MVDLGSALAAAGRQGDAATMLGEAAGMLDSQPDPYNQARARAALGRALDGLGLASEGSRHLETALAIFAELRGTASQASG
jgi:hypothetical protein